MVVMMTEETKIQLRKGMAYKKQDFFNEVAVIVVDGKEVICNMFMDEDGDIGFIYEGNDFYFKDIKRV